MAVRTAVLGASGFAGSELLRLLEGHPETQVIAATSSSRVGESLETMYPHLTKLAGLRFVSIEDALSLGVDVVFSSLPHGESGKLLARYQGRVVDLAGDFRLREATSYEPWYGEPHPYPSALPEWVYGLSEFSRDKIAGALKVANPGCYPTAALLALGPLVAGQLVDASSIHIDAKSGVSGAGRAGGEGFDFSAMNENMRAYSPSGHKHIAEMEQELAVMAGDTVTITFIPHLVPLTRGLLVTCIAPVADGVDAGTLDRAMADAYASERF
ncbi:MAG TPA: N-acetyl-gamma-glutamyl-phosphate reductase, partial [Actinomycetota bacterium]|nr:N-acetyl-gamma-glutamyl-phosphate reductase [Actinomycetota bacterium]